MGKINQLIWNPQRKIMPYQNQNAPYQNQNADTNWPDVIVKILELVKFWNLFNFRRLLEILDGPMKWENPQGPLGKKNHVFIFTLLNRQRHSENVLVSNKNSHLKLANVERKKFSGRVDPFILNLHNNETIIIFQHHLGKH